jgi:hypothetical protein
LLLPLFSFVFLDQRCTRWENCRKSQEQAANNRTKPSGDDSGRCGYQPAKQET